jgi:hypothetical protein
LGYTSTFDELFDLKHKPKTVPTDKETKSRTQKQPRSSHSSSQALFLKGANPAGLIFSGALSGFKNVTATQLDYVGPSALRAYEAFDNIDAAPLQASLQTVGGTENGNGVLGESQFSCQSDRWFAELPPGYAKGSSRDVLVV